MTAESPHIRHIVAVAVGNALEWYGFAIYGYVAVTISKLFFPPATGSALPRRNGVRFRYVPRHRHEHSGACRYRLCQDGSCPDRAYVARRAELQRTRRDDRRSARQVFQPGFAGTRTAGPG